MLVKEPDSAAAERLDGGGMAVFQTVAAFRLFAGLEPDAARMIEHFRAMAG